MKVNFIVEDMLFFKYVGCATAARMLYEGLHNHTDLNLSWNSSEKDFDIVHFHTFGPQALWYRRRSKGVNIITAHSTPRLNQENLAFSGLINLFYPWIYRGFDHIIAISERCCGEVKEMAPDIPATLIPNGIDRAKFYPDSEKRRHFRDYYHIPADAKVILTVAQQTPRKGIFDFMHLAQNCPDFTWVWVGGFPYGVFSKQYFHIQQVKRQCGSNTLFTGFVPDITETYCGADLFFMPSFAEGMSIVLLEALASGLPCVVRDIPEFREVFRNEGLYFRNTDEAAIMVSADDRLREAASKARDLSATYDNARIARRHLDFYQELL